MSGLNHIREAYQSIYEEKDPSFPIKKSSGAGALTADAAKQLGPKAVELRKKKAAAVDLPKVKKEEVELEESEKWIQKAIKKPGALKAQLDVPEGEKIPAKKLAAAAKKGGKLGQRARLAQTLKRFKEELELDEAHWDPVTKTVGEKRRTGSDPEIQKMAKKAAASGPKKRVPLGQGTRNKASSFKPSSREEAKADKAKWDSYWEGMHRKEEFESARDRMRFILDEAKKEKTLRNTNPCWKGYEPIGTKKKGGRTVPNCVPKEEFEIEEESYMEYAKRKQAEKKDNRLTVTAADKRANTPAWKQYVSGNKKYKAAPHLSTEEVDLLEKAPPGAKFERMVKHVKKGYAKDGLTDRERAIAYATAWKEYNKKKTQNEEYLLEKARGTRKKTTVHAYDVDETLFSHGKKGKPNVKVHVNDASGKRVKSLSNQEFNTHKLEKGHKYDFSEFQSAKKFKETSSPNKKVIKDIKRKQARGQNVHLITARSKFDKPDEFKGHLEKHGVKVDKKNIHYTGGMKGGDVGEKKVKVANAVAKKSGGKKVHMYDDAAKVHKSFEAEKKNKPTSMKYKTHMVAPDKKTGESKVRSYQATK